jgi:hypothetical protein
MRIVIGGPWREMKAQSKVTRMLLLLSCVSSVTWGSGCFTRKAPARPVIGVIGFAHPVIPAAAASAELEAPPDIAMDSAEAAPSLVISRSVPLRPRVTPAPVPDHVPAEKPAEPTIAPEVTSQAMTEAKVEAQHSLDQVQKNLAVAWGRTLNDAQKDLISKVRAFTDNAREAMRSGDWVRAKNLSKKAEVLSEQLAASL